MRERLVGPEHAILLDDDPAVVAAPQELVEALADVGVALTERAEDAALPGRDQVAALGAHLGEPAHVDVLHVDVVHKAAVLLEEAERIAAAERGVARVEAQADQVGVDRRHDLRHLARRLDVGARVVVERDRESALAAAGGGALEVGDEELGAVGREPRLGVGLDVARVLEAVGLEEGVGEEHERPHAAGRRGVERVERPLHRRQVILEAARSREPQRQEGAHELEAVLREHLADLRALAEVARRPELRARHIRPRP